MQKENISDGLASLPEYQQCILGFVVLTAAAAACSQSHSPLGDHEEVGVVHLGVSKVSVFGKTSVLDSLEGDKDRKDEDAAAVGAAAPAKRKDFEETSDQSSDKQHWL